MFVFVFIRLKVVPNVALLFLMEHYIVFSMKFNYYSKAATNNLVMVHAQQSGRTEYLDVYFLSFIFSATSIALYLTLVAKSSKIKINTIAYLMLCVLDDTILLNGMHLLSTNHMPLHYFSFEIQMQLACDIAHVSVFMHDLKI